MTRQQRYLERALRHVEALQGEPESSDLPKIYGGLCHSFPVLLRTNGLMQTLAFIYTKSGDTDDRKRAYRALLSHVAETLGQPADGTALLHHVHQMSNGQYIHATRALLSAWVYYKRFAESILDVQPGAEEGTET